MTTETNKHQCYTLTLGARDRNGNAVGSRTEFEAWCHKFLSKRLPYNSYKLSVTQAWNRQVTVSYSNRDEARAALAALTLMAAKYPKRFRDAVGKVLRNAQGDNLLL